MPGCCNPSSSSVLLLLLEAGERERRPYNSIFKLSTGNEIVNTIGLDDGLLLGLPVLGDIEGGGVGDSVGERVVSGGNGDCVIGFKLG